MSEHERIQSLLAAYCGGELEQDRRMEVEEHLKTCPDCAATLADLEATLKLLRSTPRVEPPPWLATRIMARVREEAPSRAGWWRWLASPRNTWLPLEGLAFLLVCVGGYFLALTMKPEMRAVPPRLRQAPITETGPSSPAAPPAEQRRQPSPVPEATPPAATKFPAPAATRPTPPEPRALPASRATEPALSAAPRREAEYAPPPPMGERSPAPSGHGSSPGAAAPAQSMDRLESFGAAMEKKAVKRAAKQEQVAGETATPYPMRLTLSVRDRATAESAIRQAVTRSLGLIPDEWQPSTGNRIVARIPASRLPELAQRLKLLGELSGMQEPPSGVRGEILLELSW